MDVQTLFHKPKGITYFDSAASSLTALPVLEKMQEYYRDYRANIHRGAHRITRKASEEYEAVYGKLAKFFRAGDQEFTAVRNTTEAINGVALGLDWHAGDEVVITDNEHHSNLLPWLRLKEKGVKVHAVHSDAQGRFSASNFAPLLSKKTRLVAFTACSNVLGCKVPVKEIAKAAKDAGALVLVDAAQYVGHHAVDLKDWSAVDYLAFSGHKCFGPTGIGALFHRKGAPLEPWFVGGGTIREVTLEGYKLLGHRERFEAGTPAIAEWIGLGAAIDVMSKIGIKSIEAHEDTLAKEMLTEFGACEGVTLYGPADAKEKSSALFAFNVKGVKHHEAAVMLDSLGFAVRSGHHCAMPLTKKLGVEGTVRASLHMYNDEGEVRRFGEALKKVAALG
ncbi:MAG: cysteine desulfurase [Candidatus Micrarchaeota archaeon]